MHRRSSRTLFILVLAAALSVAGATHAYALAEAPVRIHAVVNGTDLYRMTADEARAAIKAQTPLAALPASTFTAGGKTFKIAAATGLSVDVEGMLAQAYVASDSTVTVQPRYKVKSTSVTSFVNAVGTSVYLKPRNAYYYPVADGRLRWKAGAYGRKLDKVAATTAVKAVLLASANTQSAQPTKALRTVRTTPTVTNGTLGRAIIVDLSQRKLRLYDHSTIVKKYGVAIGSPGHETPKGKWKVVRKSSRPSWYNPGSAWAANMPAVIGPGPNNPLGLRALYLDAPGIRIHGTSKGYSIGTAASHGCVRVYNPNIVKLYPEVPVGTPVWIVK